MLRSFLLALSFLSRLVPGRPAADDEVSASLVFYAPAGLALGLAAAAPFALGLAQGKPLLQGLLYAVFLAWLTRALHWDGWADVFDALGSGRSGQEFQQVLKDSRIGAFGALALVFGVAAQIAGSAACLESGAWAALVWAVLLGRCLVAPLAFSLSPAGCSSLGALMCAGAGLSPLLLSLAFAVGGGLICVGPAAALTSLAVAAAGLLCLRRSAARGGGLNGDFMGAAIIWGELSGLLTAAWL